MGELGGGDGGGQINNRRKARWQLLADTSSPPFVLVIRMPDGLFGAGAG